MNVIWQNTVYGRGCPKTGMGSRPAETIPKVNARWNSRETRGVVQRWVIARCTLTESAIPIVLGGNHFGNIAAEIAHILALRVQVVAHRIPLRHARNMPACRTDTASAWERLQDVVAS